MMDSGYKSQVRSCFTLSGWGNFGLFKNPFVRVRDLDVRVRVVRVRVRTLNGVQYNYWIEVVRFIKTLTLIHLLSIALVQIVKSMGKAVKKVEQ